MAEIVNCLGDILRIHAELSPDRVVVGSLSHEAEQTTVTDLDPHEARIDGVIDVLESELRGCSGVTGNHDCRVADCDAVTHRQARGALDPVAIDEGAVGRAEVSSDPLGNTLLNDCVFV